MNPFHPVQSAATLRRGFGVFFNSNSLMLHHNYVTDGETCFNANAWLLALL
ncbi:hypothetical protein [Shimia aestuarii]|uniref:hypothetical protein n=1 Tax=Shimia aestuarii TaxID=254406 RepID=UPI001FB2F393|nr:hypothetical protein [Shimia aestuarii]